MKKAFLAYAKVDKNIVSRLRTHLGGLKHLKELETWFDGEIPAGERWEEQISRELNRSDIAVLCVSADFLNSDYVQTVEVPRALARHDKGECFVIPVILKPCAWEDHPFARLQVTPEEGKPVTKHTDPEEAWTEVTKAISRAIKSAPRRTEPSSSATPRDAQPSRPQQAQKDRNPDKNFGYATVSVYSAGAGLARVDILALFPNSTWLRETTNAEGLAHLKLHSNHLPLTVFAAAPNYAACIEHGWAPDQILALQMSQLPGGGSIIFPEGAGALPGLEGQINPIRDSLDRTYLYTENIAVNDGQTQPPVDFECGEELCLTDAVGNQLTARIIAIEGHSALVEYHM